MIASVVIVDLNSLLRLTEQIICSAIHVLEFESNSVVMSRQAYVHVRLDDWPSTLTTVQDTFITHSLSLTVSNELSRSSIEVTRYTSDLKTVDAVLVLRSKTSCFRISEVNVYRETNLTSNIDSVNSIVIIIRKSNNFHTVVVSACTRVVPVRISVVVLISTATNSSCCASRSAVKFTNSSLYARTLPSLVDNISDTSSNIGSSITVSSYILISVSPLAVTSRHVFISNTNKHALVTLCQLSKSSTLEVQIYCIFAVSRILSILERLNVVTIDDVRPLNDIVSSALLILSSLSSDKTDLDTLQTSSSIISLELARINIHDNVLTYVAIRN